MSIIDYSLRFNNYPIVEARKKLKEIHNLQQNNFDSYVDKQKKKIVKYHLDNTPFYRELVNNKDWNWNSLPVLEKKELQVSLQERLSKDYTLKNVFKNKTSGSTGNPFSFAKDKFSHALTWAIITNRFNWHNLYGKKQARFYGFPKDKLSKNKELLKDVFSNRYRFNVFDVSDKALENWIEKFKTKNFVYLNGYTTVILVFAKYLIFKNIVLKDICNTLKACVVTSEMLFENDKEILKKAFGVPIINEYGASELDLIAFEDSNNNWILNTETLFVEVLDDNNNILEDGKIGNLVITSLYNKANPFIRYKIGDKGAIKRINKTQFILEKLQGRSEDLVKLPSGKIAPGLTFYYITKSIMEDSGEVKEIKVIQTHLDTFKIEYVSIRELERTQKEKIEKALLDYLEPNLKIEFFKLDELERSKSGKLKQFTSLIKNN
ncbi:phenylacetate--CoA ligase family protein [Polaribacter pectinis]|uniref:Phenylacetate--CoA ligase family protein n=1 Tax=Polaribacter pectinis TaxID=2738844 RepID=A0A7G9LCC7_9FLAO|nr:phenylacetate--CoA ligase family protein [Polaribacter pectinis]QNM86276.1 phenylacetate--CoA ligase family protein [Polaribacter pectinis]